MSTIPGRLLSGVTRKELSSALTPDELTRLTLYRRSYQLLRAGFAQRERAHLMFLRWAYEHGRIPS